jgi:hypothetical protein
MSIQFHFGAKYDVMLFKRNQYLNENTHISGQTAAMQNYTFQEKILSTSVSYSLFPLPSNYTPTNLEDICNLYKVLL